MGATIGKIPSEDPKIDDGKTSTPQLPQVPLHSLINEHNIFNSDFLSSVVKLYDIDSGTSGEITDDKKELLGDSSIAYLHLQDGDQGVLDRDYIRQLSQSLSNYHANPSSSTYHEIFTSRMKVVVAVHSRMQLAREGKLLKHNVEERGDNTGANEGAVIAPEKMMMNIPIKVSY